MRQTDAAKRLPTAAWLLLALSAGFALLWSHHRILDQDEFLSFYSDSVPTLHDVLRVQLHSPISLDPPAYHLLSHLSMDVFGRSPFALRLPAMLGFLVMQWAIFRLVRRVASERTALIAMALPFATATFRYAQIGRPYGLLLGLYAVAIYCWFTAANTTLARSRKLACVGLVLSLALAITSHYFGVLIVLPLCCGELARMVRSRRFDLITLSSIALGLAIGVSLILPFQAALVPYRQHYYTVAVGLRSISQGYRELFVRYNDWPRTGQRIVAALLVVATAMLLSTAIRYVRRGRRREDASFWGMLLGLAALPLFGFLFGRFVTHTLEVRYLTPTLIAFCVLIALALQGSLQARAVFFGWFSAILLIGSIASSLEIRSANAEKQTWLTALKPSPALAAELRRHPEQKLYTQNLSGFFLLSHYLSDASLRPRLRLVYDEHWEVTWLEHNTNAVTAHNLVQFTDLRTTPYCDFLAQPDALLVEYPTTWEWIGKELASTHSLAVPQGPALGGTLVRVTSTHACGDAR